MVYEATKLNAYNTQEWHQGRGTIEREEREERERERERELR